MEPAATPRHVAIICDGNRRWAKAHGLAAAVGHQTAAQHIFEPLVDSAIESGVAYLTFWIFSTENWQRSPAEVEGLLQLLRQQLDHYAAVFDQRRVQIRTIGDLTKFPADIREKIGRAVTQTQDHDRLTVILALNYGGRDELTRAVRLLAEQVHNGTLLPEHITTETVGAALDTAVIPDPDLIIRTGGEQRLSGFMPWQAVYAEYAFPEVYFPELTPTVFKQQIAEFVQRQRRFGR